MLASCSVYDLLRTISRTNWMCFKKQIAYWAVYIESMNIWRNWLLCDADKEKVIHVMIQNLQCVHLNLLNKGIMVEGKKRQCASVKYPHPLAVPHGNAPNAVRTQTYQGLFTDLRTRSKTCRGRQSKLDLTSTSSPRLWKYLGDSWGRLCWKLPRRHAKLYFWC